MAEKHSWNEVHLEKLQAHLLRYFLHFIEQECSSPR